MKYSTIIFDLDGTLVDSKINFPAIYQSLGLEPGKSIIEHIHSLKEEEQKSARELVHFYENQGAENSNPIPGVLELIDELSHQNVNMAVFTLNSRSIALKTLERHNIAIPILISREDAKPKPDPEGLFKICNHYGTPTDKALYVGDYKYDLIAGLKANIKTALYSALPPSFDTKGAYMQFAHFNELFKYLIRDLDMRKD